MGTNYYWSRTTELTCPTCGQVNPKLHIGKQSYGWTFMFSTELGISAKDVYAALEKGGVITDEYGETFTLDHIKDMVDKNKNKRTLNQIDISLGKVHADDEGNFFMSGEFS